jgi:lipopolysaccharide exporter
MSRMAAGAAWMVLFKLADRSLGLVSTLILARLLMPADFGIVAMATSLMALIELFSAFGMDTALIQRRDATVTHYNSAWTLNVLAGLLVGLLMFAIAVPASHFYSEPKVVLVIITVGVGAVLQGLENVGVVDFRKELQFDKEFRYLMAKRFIGFGLTVPLAFWLQNYWALVLGNLGTRAIVLGLSYAVHPFRPRFSLGAARELMGFSKWLVLLNGLAFLRERSADFIIGRVSGPATLGTFSVASQIASMPSTELIAPINRAVLPAYAKLANDRPALARQYLSVMSGIALLGVPAVTGLAAVAPLAVMLALGPKWREAALVLEILVFFGITQVLQTNAYSAFLAIGKPKVFAKINGIHVAALLTSLLLLTPRYGLVGTAWAFVIAALIALPVNFVLITRNMGLRIVDLVIAVWRPLVASAAMYGVVRLLGPVSTDQMTRSLEALVPLFVCIALGVATYVASIALLWAIAGRPDGAETWVARQVGDRLGRLRAQRQSS